jgi:UDP-N-acetyl-D-galactosamine dehydrogenase
VISEFRSYNADVDVCDQWVDADEAKHEYGLDLVREPQLGHYDAIVLAVSHRDFIDMGAARIRAFGKTEAVLFDVKHVFERDDVDGRL